MQQLLTEASRGQVDILVGPNGAGKSRLLDALARHYVRNGRMVFAVANTIYDKFSVRHRRFRRLSARQGQHLAEFALKRALEVASREDPVRLQQITSTLGHCGYDARVGLRVKGFKSDFEKLLYMRQSEGKIAQRDYDELLALCRRFADAMEASETLWLSFRDDDFTGFMLSTFAQLIPWETALRRAHVLKRIEVFVSRKERPIPLRAASSGELSLIATMAFLTSSAQPGCVILIDEPENSLHPQWQRIYIDLLLDLLYLYEPNVFIATHAPLVVSGGQSEKGQTVVYEVVENEVNRVPETPASVEGLLWQAFHTVTPENHYLSENLVALLDALGKGEVTLGETERQLHEFRLRSYDIRQATFLEAVQTLARQIADQPQRRAENDSSL
jgi:predicted ATPase